MIKFNKSQMDEKLKNMMEFIKSVEENQDTKTNAKNSKTTKTS